VSTGAFMTLSRQLCPWLLEPLQDLEDAWKRQRLGHAWLIAGPAGLGKVNLALVVADRLLRGTTGGAAPSALGPNEAIEAMRERHAPTDHHPDLHWLHPEEDKRTISVEQVREVTETLSLKGFQGNAKVVLIEPAEAMTVAAANALLKSLEEPTADTYMLLISHQPGRLPSTIRSRCQTLLVPRPKEATVDAWLGDPQPPGGAGTVGGRIAGPLILARGKRDGEDKKNNTLSDSLNLLCESKADPQAVAADWLKQDVDASLDWLVAMLRRTIRARIGTGGSNPVTDPADPLLHNGLRFLTLSALFDQLQATERLREQLGGGVNVELALRALLLGFTPDRGRL
jgi:DNA polymerase III subunit delta'